MKYFHIIIIVCAFLLTACPHSVEKMIDDSLPPKGEKRVYIKGAANLNTILTENSDNEDSSGAEFHMEIRQINAGNYPESIELRANVFDSKGRFVLGLAPPYFRGKDYRKYWKKISDSSLNEKYFPDNFDVREVRIDKGQPYAVSFVLDHSGSMGDKRTRKLQKAVKRVLGIIKRGDYVSAIKFTSKLFKEVRLTNDREKFASYFSVDGRKALGDGTALYDAAALSIEELNKAPKGYEKAMALFTDGMDGSSKATLDSILIYAKKSDVVIYPIVFGIGFVDFEALQKMADYTGGQLYHIYSEKEFTYVFADIYITLNNFYRIRYKPPFAEALHEVELELNLNGDSIHADGLYDRSVFRENEPVGTVVFLNIEFETGSFEIKKESFNLITKVAGAMKKNRQLEIKICGHTDDVGEDEKNLDLSINRAKSVRDELVKMGVNCKRLKTEGFGESMPLVPNTSPENRKKNRRTEFIVIKN